MELRPFSRVMLIQWWIEYEMITTACNADLDPTRVRLHPKLTIDEFQQLGRFVTDHWGYPTIKHPSSMAWETPEDTARRWLDDACDRWRGNNVIINGDMAIHLKQAYNMVMHQIGKELLKARKDGTT